MEELFELPFIALGEEGRGRVVVDKDKEPLYGSIPDIVVFEGWETRDTEPPLLLPWGDVDGTVDDGIFV